MSMDLTLSCPSIQEDFPLVHTGRGEDRSPALHLDGLSPQAVTLAVTLEDIDHPLFRDFTHWLLWNVPAAPAVQGNLPAGRVLPALGKARQGWGYGFHRYAGPKPPKGQRHRYRFTVYALDAAIELGPWQTKAAFLRKAQGHILQTASLTAAFGG